jgi:hypothetical protein
VQQAYERKIRLVEDKIVQMKTMRRDLKKAMADCIKQSASGHCPIAERCSAQFIPPWIKNDEEVRNEDHIGDPAYWPSAGKREAERSQGSSY